MTVYIYMCTICLSWLCPTYHWFIQNVISRLHEIPVALHKSSFYMFSCGYKLIDLLLQFLHCYVIIDFSGSANFKLILVQHINLISQSQRNGPTIRNKQSNHFHIRCSDIRKLISDLFIFFSLILMLGFAAHKKLFYEKLGFFFQKNDISTQTWFILNLVSHYMNMEK